MLPPSYIINSLLESRYSSNENQHPLSLKSLTSKQQLKIKGPIVDANNRLYGLFDSFDPFSSKFSPRNKLINIFPSCFSFHLFNRKYAEVKKVHLHKFNEIILYVLTNLKTAIVVSDVSIKNQVTIFIVHIHIHDPPVIKTIHHTVNITSTKAELFAIRCNLNQATQLTNIEQIIVVTDSIHVAKKIFNSSVYPYQV